MRGSSVRRSTDQNRTFPMDIQARAYDTQSPGHTLPDHSASLDWPLDIAGFMGTPLAVEPFPHLVMPGFVKPPAAVAAREGFPGFGFGGVVPAPTKQMLGTLEPGFATLLGALRSPETTAAFAAKFGVELSPDALMVTLRDRCRPQDGRIHTDSDSKVVTALIYLNESWTAPGGRLRLLRKPDDIDAVIAEVPPLDGTLVAFRRTDNSWHGHKPHDGVRRYIMLNWMVDAAAAKREIARHTMTAAWKRLLTGGSGPAM